ncbi:uncharacterized protein V6R79_001230 [Siganus canaliculatus]
MMKMMKSVQQAGVYGGQTVECSQLMLISFLSTGHMLLIGQQLVHSSAAANGLRLVMKTLAQIFLFWSMTKDRLRIATSWLRPLLDDDTAGGNGILGSGPDPRFGSTTSADLAVCRGSTVSISRTTEGVELVFVLFRSGYVTKLLLVLIIGEKPMIKPDVSSAFTLLQVKLTQEFNSADNTLRNPQLVKDKDVISGSSDQDQTPGKNQTCPGSDSR